MNTYKTLAELTAEQKTELKQRMIESRNEERGQGTSYDELANADELITDEELDAEYGGVAFTDEDFSAPPSEEKHTYTCAKCGGTASDFDPDWDGQNCPHCGYPGKSSAA